MKKLHFLRKFLLTCSFAALATAGISHAATLEWDGNGSASAQGMNSANNWNPNANVSTNDEALVKTLAPTNPLVPNGTLTAGNFLWNTANTSGSLAAGNGAFAQVIRLTGNGGSTAAIANGGATGDLLLVGSAMTSGIFTLSSAAGTGGFSLQLRVSDVSGNFNVVNAGATLDVQSVMTTNASTSIKVTKTGAGTMILRADSSATYLGDFDVSAGTMLLAGGNVSNASTQIAVLSGGRLSGNGSVRDLVVSGTLAPNSSTGIGVGNLNVLGSLSLNSTASTKFDIASAASFDTITATGAVALNGAFELSFGSLLADGTSIDLFAGAGALSGDFTSITGVGSYSGSFIDGGTTWTYSNGSQTLTFDSTTGVLSVAAVPEPATAALAVMGLTVGFLFRRRVSRQA